MAVSDLKAFQALLANGGTEDDVDRFLADFEASSDRLSKHLHTSFGKGGSLREQIPFLAELYSKGFCADRSATSKTAFVIFGSFFDSLGTAAMRSWLARMDASAIYLYDARLLNFALGVEAFGAGVAAMEAAVTRWAKDAGAERMITVGASAAGFTAIKRAITLNAYAAVTFSPFTTFAEAQYKKDGRGTAIIDRFKEAAPDYLIDLVPLLAETRPLLKVMCFYGAGMPLDAWHAQRIGALREILTVGVNVDEHDAFGPLINSGAFHMFMKSLADGMGIDHSASLVLSHFSANSPDLPDKMHSALGADPPA